ncbi:hypothetical protein ZOSMA_944G00010 [Zostera marina]|uniref:Uncharacterized protein n=1 Tax=Zostera marina TaxID=29655 RepID=A0A0K9NIE5_ZOSMR|nr:hypothetical protein ZOSMA_944G00010 [Zostera marina]
MGKFLHFQLMIESYNLCVELSR